MQFLENGQYVLLTVQACTKLAASWAEDSSARFYLHNVSAIAKFCFTREVLPDMTLSESCRRQISWQANASIYSLSKFPNTTKKKKYIKLLEMSTGHFKHPGNSLPPPVSHMRFIEMVNTAISLPLPPLQRKIKERLIWNHISFIISCLFCCCWAATVNDLSEINQNVTFASSPCKYKSILKRFYAFKKSIEIWQEDLYRMSSLLMK